MLITREMDYAVRILRALSVQAPLTSSQIAVHESLTRAITYKLLKRLGKAGIVESRRGQTGGYSLKKSCRELTLYDLFTLLNDPLLLNECLQPDYDCANNVGGHCGVHREFCRIQRCLEQELRRKTLAELFCDEVAHPASDTNSETA
jgi:Rrf2 family protein